MYELTSEAEDGITHLMGVFNTQDEANEYYSSIADSEDWPIGVPLLYNIETDEAWVYEDKWTKVN